MTVIVLLYVASFGQVAEPIPVPARNPAEILRLHAVDVREEISVLLKEHATAEEPLVKRQRFEEIVALYRAIEKDRRFSASPALQEGYDRLRTRLLAERTAAVDRERRAQRNRARVRDAIAPRWSDEASVAYSLAGETNGGPIAIAERAALGGGAVDDNADQLIALIQSVVQPEHWNVNGGPGTIVFFAPVHALVIRANAEAHASVGGLVEGIRAADE